MNDLLLGIQNGIALLTISRPKSLNTLNGETLSELDTYLSEIEKREDVKTVILTGSGEKSFVAGADIPEMVNTTPMERSAMGQLTRKAFGHLEEMPQVTIAAVNGYALGGDCEILMACDIRITSENAKFAQPRCDLGILPGFGGTRRLSRPVGKGRTKELISAYDMIDAQETCRIGLTNKVVPLAELIDYCKAMAGRIMKSAPTGVALARGAISTGSDTDLNSGLKLEANLFGLSFSTQDKKGGTTVFLEERKEKRFIGK